MSQVLEQALHRQQLAINPASSVWVSASAGTGKTTVLVNRFLALLLSGTYPERILCLTYTKAAATEMKERILAKAQSWLTKPAEDLREEITFLAPDEDVENLLPKARQLFSLLLDVPDGLRIMTLHSFCQSTLSRFPLEAGLSPHFTLLEETGELIQRAVHQVLENINQNPNDDLADSFQLLVQTFGERGLMDVVGTMLARRGTLAQLNARYTETGYKDHLAKAVGLPADFSAEKSVQDFLDNRTSLKGVCEVLRTGKFTFQALAEKIATFENLSKEEQAVELGSYADLFYDSNQNLKTAESLSGKALYKKQADVLDALGTESQHIDKVLQQLRAADVVDVSMALWKIGTAILSAYQDLKIQQGVLDFDDLVIATKALLQKPGISPWVLFKLDGGLDHVLVDEAQDTSPAQWEILQLLVGDFYTGEAREKDRTLFVVGDLKQSIFSFQGAVPDQFVRMKKYFVDKVISANQMWTPVPLHLSFRSTYPVLKAVDEIFSTADAQQGLYEDKIEHFLKRQGEEGVVEIWPAFGAEKAPPPEPWSLPLTYKHHQTAAAEMADAIASRIARMLKEKEMLGSQARPIEPKDIMILLYKRPPLAVELEAALTRHGVPVAGRDRLILTDDLAVKDLLAFLSFLALPQDDLILASLLKSPFFNVTEEELFQLCHGRKGSVWQSLQTLQEHNEKFDSIVNQLSHFLAKADFVRPSALLAELLYEQSGRAVLFSRFGGGCDEIIQEFLAEVSRFEADHPPSLQGFLHWMTAQKKELKRDQEAGDLNQVRIMTVHGSKGLQAPIVFLADTFADPHIPSNIKMEIDAESELLLWLPAKKIAITQTEKVKGKIKTKTYEEYNRLLYVALTRAADRLYVTGAMNSRQVGSGGSDKLWYNMIWQGLEDSATQIEIAGRTALQLTSSQTVDVETAVPSKTVTNAEQLADWVRAPAPVEGAVAQIRPSKLGLETARKVRKTRSFSDQKESLLRGQAIHALLEVLPSYSATEWTDVAGRLLTTFETTDVQKLAYYEEVTKVISAPHLSFVFDKNAYQEVSITAELGGGVLTGQIDRLVRASNTFWVLDFKTNRQVPTSVEGVDAGYIGQLAAYQQAVQKAYPDQEVRCALIFTKDASLLEIPTEILARQRIAA